MIKMYRWLIVLLSPNSGEKKLGDSCVSLVVSRSAKFLG